MRREPPSRQRRVALAGVHVDRLVGVPTVSVSNVFAVEPLVFSKRIVRAKSVGIDVERFLLAVRQQEPDVCVDSRDTLTSRRQRRSNGVTRTRRVLVGERDTLRLINGRRR